MYIVCVIYGIFESSLAWFNKQDIHARMLLNINRLAMSHKTDICISIMCSMHLQQPVLDASLKYRVGAIS